MSAQDERGVHRQRVDDLLREIDVQRRQQLRLEAAGAYAPGLEQKATQMRRELAQLVN